MQKQGLEFREPHQPRKKFHRGFNSRQSGFTLLELFIAISLGIVMSLGLIQLFVTARQTYTASNAISSIEENANAAINTLTNVISFAGHQGVAGSLASGETFMGCYTDAASPNNLFATTLGTGMTFNQCLQAATCPCIVAAPGTSVPASNSNPNCPVCSYSSNTFGSTTYYYGTTYNSFALQSFNGTTGTCMAGYNINPFANNSAITCSNAATTDYIFIVQGAATQSYNFNDSNHSYSGGKISIPNFSGVLGTGSGVNSDTLLVTYSGDASGQITDCQGNTLNQYTMVANYFSIQLDSNNNPYLACTFISMNTLTNTAWSSPQTIRIASGVEAFRVMFAQDTDFDGAPNVYLNGSGFSGVGTVSLPLGISFTSGPYFNAKNAGVVGVQIALLMQSPNAASTSQDTKTYSLLGNTHEPFNDMKMRKLYTSTLTSNECLPSIRADCKGAPIWGGVSAGWSGSAPSGGTAVGLINISSTVWFTMQPVSGTIYGCTMDASGNMSAVSSTVSPPPTNPSAGPSPVPYLINTWTAATSSDGKFNCYFR